MSGLDAKKNKISPDENIWIQVLVPVSSSPTGKKDCKTTFFSGYVIHRNVLQCAPALLLNTELRVIGWQRRRSGTKSQGGQGAVSTLLLSLQLAGRGGLSSISIP